MVQRLLGYGLLGGGVLLFAVVWFNHSQSRTEQLIFSPTQVLESTWLTYKTRYVQSGTYRTVDTSRGDLTTSEGQSYTMLRAAWMGDKQTFDGAWQWTQNNIAHSNDHLFSWAWGRLPTGKYGVLTSMQGQNSASDADTDIAMSLLFAYSRWQDPSYLTEAQGIMQDIWDKEVVMIGGTPYLAADDLEKTSSNSYAVLNPSYFNPAAYRLFARVDLNHPWSKLVNSSYAVLNETASQPLGNGASAGLPPNWVLIDKQTGKLAATHAPYGDTNFSYDALRVPWRIALDWEWNQDPRAHTLLSKFSFLTQQWESDQRIASNYTHAGDPVTTAENPAMYGGTIGYFLVADPAHAQAVYEQKLLSLYNPGANTWSTPLSYYDDNWTWFGIGLYNHLLPDLGSQLPQGTRMYSSINITQP